MAVYDSKISDDVSVSSIIDCMLLEDDSPEEIVNVLRMYSKDDIKKVALDCSRWFRLFQYDFFIRLSEENKQFVFDLLSTIPKKIAAFFLWQLCQPSADISVRNRNFSRTFIATEIMLDGTIPHPYKYAVYSPEFDRAFFSKDIYQICKEEKEKMQHFILQETITHSLFMFRMLQDDFFENLNELSKWTFLKQLGQNCEYIEVNALFNFYKQIVFSDNFCKDIKQFAINYIKYNRNLYLYNYPFTKNACNINFIKEDDEYKQLLFDSKIRSYAELSIKAAVLGKELNDNVALFMFLNERFSKKILEQWSKEDPESLKLPLEVFL